jgi:glycosyltransferase involved in cell wall biosynthesis
MSRNLLPFEFPQIRLYGVSKRLLRFSLLRLSQIKTIRNANGTIFLHDYGRSLVLKKVRKLSGPQVIIPHGVSEQFRAAPKEQKELNAYSKEEPFKLLYVSTVEAYKHQWHVAEAVSRLVSRDVPITLELIGPAHPPSLKRLHRVVRRLNAEEYIHYRGTLPYTELPSAYSRADAFIFASSCENLPNALLEAMSAGLPIACSNKAPMPQILGDGGLYFEPTNPEDMASVIHRLIVSPSTRKKCSSVASERARPYTWRRCAEETFSFLEKIALQTSGALL